MFVKKLAATLIGSITLVLTYDRVEEALRKCPELVCVHVETIGGYTCDGSA